MTVSTDDELQAWLDEQDSRAILVAKEEKIARQQWRMPTFEEMQFNFKRQLYAKAINANQGEQP